MAQSHEQLVPANYGAPVAYGVQQVLQFPDLSLRYLGKDEKNWQPGEPTVNWTIKHFSVTADGAAPQMLEVRSGQVPPQPLTFTIGQKAYTLYTHRLPDGSQLMSDQLMVAPALKE